jgi:hypothetical protein
LSSIESLSPVHVVWVIAALTVVIENPPRGDGYAAAWNVILLVEHFPCFSRA